METDNFYKVLSNKNTSDREIWRSICQSFKKIDLYFYPEYAKLFELHGDGESFLFVYYQSKKDIVIYPFLKRSLKQLSGLQVITQDYFDITSPYGYGGYLPSTDNIDMEKVFTCFHNYCLSNNIISEFVRFHPILENIKYVPKNIDIKQCNETIYIDLEDDIEVIWKNMTTRCRNAIRKANRNDVTIVHDNEFNNIDIFCNLYNDTMNRLKARKYYFFSEDWFHNLINLLKNKVALFHAKYQGKIISSAIFIYNDFIINYFLTGSLFEMRHLSVNNLLLYEVSIWAKKMGIRYFHLGGGYQPNDNLYAFKKSFSPLKKDYYIGNIIHNQAYYEYICKKIYHKDINNSINYFPLYRYHSQNNNMI